MRILFFIHSLGSGGAERVLSLLANEWQNNRHDITIALNNPDNIFYYLDSDINILDISLIQKGFAKKITGNINRILKIKKTIENVDPDIVISFMTTSNINVTVAAKLANKPAIISERNNFHRIRSPIWRLLRRITYPFSTALVLQTSYDAKMYNYHSNAHIIENPLIIENCHNNIKREKIILAVGRLHPNKGFDLLIDAFSQLKRSADWKLIILGEGKERKKLENQIEKLKLNKNVSLPGTITDVERYYKKASIFVLSSRREGFPNVLCEAMAYGCPAVAFDCLTGPRDIITHNINGLLVAAENVPDLMTAIQKLIEDDGKRDTISKNSVKIIERLSIHKISKQWLEVISGVTNSKTPLK